MSKPEKKAGDAYTPTTYARAVRRGCEAAGIVPHWFPHQLRHTAATLIRKAAGLEVARAALGHSTMSVTDRPAFLETLTRAVAAAKKAPTLKDRLAEMSAAMNDLDASRHATPEQRSYGKRCKENLAYLRAAMERGSMAHAIEAAILVGSDYQKVRYAGLVGPATSGGKRGTFFRGRWIEVEPMAARLADALDDLGPGEHDWATICAKAWRKPFDGRSTKYCKALAVLTRAIAELNPPLMIRIYRPRQKYGRSESVIIEENTHA